jgi:hypothetical protein
MYKHAKPTLKVGEYYINPHSQHVKNECIYGIIGLDFVLEQVLDAKKVEKKKILPIFYCLPSLQQGLNKL